MAKILDHGAVWAERTIQRIERSKSKTAAAHRSHAAHKPTPNRSHWWARNLKFMKPMFS